jgi:hypothetical protein
MHFNNHAGIRHFRANDAWGVLAAIDERADRYNRGENASESKPRS